MLLCRKKYINVSVAFLFCSQKLKPEVELQLMLTSGDRSLTDGLPMSNFFQIRARQLRKYKTIFIPKAVKRLRLTFSQAKLLRSEKTQNSRTASRHATQNLVLNCCTQSRQRHSNGKVRQIIFTKYICFKFNFAFKC